MNEIIKKVFIIGDSHVDAIKRALKHKKSSRTDIEYNAKRFNKIKNGVEIGDISIEKFLDRMSDLSTKDIIVTAIGGNQHQSIGLIQHPVPFNFFAPTDESIFVSDNEQCIPYHIIREFLETKIRESDEVRIKKIAGKAPCKVFQLAPPPPKEDESHIRALHETDFVKRGLLEKGVTAASLRLRLWKLQCSVLSNLCNEWGVNFQPVPVECLTENGFLKQEYYAKDATHANEAYGKLILEQIELLMEQMK